VVFDNEYLFRHDRNCPCPMLESLVTASGSKKTLMRDDRTPTTRIHQETVYRVSIAYRIKKAKRRLPLHASTMSKIKLQEWILQALGARLVS
jgi:hypothetical protein